MLRRRHLAFALLVPSVVATACLVFDGKTATEPGEAGANEGGTGDGSAPETSTADTSVTGDTGGVDANTGDVILCGTVLPCPFANGERCCAKKTTMGWESSEYACESPDEAGKACPGRNGYACSSSAQCGEACCAGRGQGDAGPYSYTLCRANCESGEVLLCASGQKGACAMCKVGPDLPPDYSYCQ
jgi:hypothetical protein